MFHTILYAGFLCVATAEVMRNIELQSCFIYDHMSQMISMILMFLCSVVLLECCFGTLRHNFLWPKVLKLLKQKTRELFLWKKLDLDQQSAEVNQRLDIYFIFLDLNQDNSFAMLNLNQFWSAFLFSLRQGNPRSSRSK